MWATAGRLSQWPPFSFLPPPDVILNPLRHFVPPSRLWPPPPRLTPASRPSPSLRRQRRMGAPSPQWEVQRKRKGRGFFPGRRRKEWGRVVGRGLGGVGKRWRDGVNEGRRRETEGWAVYGETPTF